MANEFVARNGLIAQDSSTISGSLTVTNGIVGSLTGTASYANNADTLDGLNSSVFTSTSSFQNYTSSANAGLTALNDATASLNNYTSSNSMNVAILFATSASLNANVAGLNLQTASLLNYTSSTDAKIASIYTTTASLNASVAGLNTYSASLNNKTSSFATTGSNTFTSTQTITGSLNVSGNITTPGTITATTLVVQTITSSQNFVTGSTKFGILTSNTHQFTGSVSASGSLNVNNGVLVAGGTNVGINTTSPNKLFTVKSTTNDTTTFAGFYAENLTQGIELWYGGIQMAGSNTNVSLNLASKGAESITFSTNGSEHMRVTSGGNVGIGTTSPTAKLHVSGTTGGVFEVDGASAVTALYVSASGNVGIGTTNPYAFSNYRFLTIEDTSGAGVTFRTSGTERASFYGYSGGADLIAAGYLQIYAGGSTKMFIQGNGNVGIGTTSPGYTLQVGNTGAGYNMAIIGSTTAGIEIRTSTAGGRIAALEQYFANEGSLWLYDSNTVKVLFRASGSSYINPTVGNVGIGITTPSYKLSINGSAGIEASEEYLYFHSTYSVGSNARAKIRAVGAGGGSGYGGDLRLSSRASNNVWNEDVLTIANTGNVGIGTTSPANKLDVSGILRVVMPDDPLTGAITAKILSYSPSPFGLVFRGYETGAHSIQSQREANNAQLYALSLQPLGGNVGIGTTSPNALLSLYSASTALLNFRNSTNASSTYGFGIEATGNNSELWNYANGYMRFGTNNNERIRITSDGNVGIGTTSPSQKLDVVGRFNASGVDYHSLVVSEGSAQLRLERTSTSTGLMYIGADNVGFKIFDSAFATRLTLTSGGNLGIGTTSPSARLDVYNGNARFWHGNTTHYTQFENSNEINTYTSGDTISTMFLNWVSGGDVNIARSAIFAKSAGSVGIGTTSPAAKLHVSNGGQYGIEIDVANEIIQAYNRTSAEYQEIKLYSSNLRFFNGTSATITERMRITSGGNVGIGTTSPAKLLDINGTAIARSGLVVKYSSNTGEIDTAYAPLLVNGPSTNTITFDEETTTATLVLRGYQDNVNLQLGTGGSTYGYAGWIQAGYDNGGSTGSEPMLLNPIGGNIGIATTSPAYTLDVAGTGRFTGGLLVNTGTQTQTIGSDGTYGSTYPMISFTGISNGSHRIFAGTADDMYFAAATSRGFEFRPNGGTSSALKILAGGSVGIGTTSPSSLFEVYGNSGDGTPTFKVTSTAAGDTFNWAGTILNSSLGSSRNYLLIIGQAASTKNSGYIGYNHSGTGGSNSNYLTFGHFGSDNLVNINGVGNVGIGTTTPTQLLHIIGANAANNGITIQNTNSSGNSQVRFLNTSGTERAAITYVNSADAVYHYTAAGGNIFNLVGGSVGINTTSPSNALHVVGTIRWGSGGTAYSNYTDTDGGGMYIETVDNNTSRAKIRFQTRVNNSGGYTSYQIDADNNQHYWAINGSTRMTLNSSFALVPGSNGTQDLGSDSLRWATVFTSDLDMSNGIGDYTIVEGEEDLFLYNNKTNKVFKFVIQEVDPSEATPKMKR
jgi:hypothetical protein